MLRVEKSFEIRNAMLDALAPHLKHFSVVEQVLERPIWIAHVMPMRSGAPDEEAPQWRRFISSSTHGLLGIVLNPIWDRVQVHGVLPAPTLGNRKLQLVRCTQVWDAVSVERPVRSSWIFVTTKGTFADPEFGLELRGVRRESLRWKDCERDWDARGRLVT